MKRQATTEICNNEKIKDIRDSNRCCSDSYNTDNGNDDHDDDDDDDDDVDNDDDDDRNED